MIIYAMIFGKEEKSNHPKEDVIVFWNDRALSIICFIQQRIVFAEDVDHVVLYIWALFDVNFRALHL